MLLTPLGEIEVLIDAVPLSYHAVECPCDKTCPDLTGRYTIKVELLPDGKTHEIQCRIKNHIASEQDGIESGERLELKSFYRDSCKVSIGMEGEADYFIDGTRAGSYDYDNEYLEDGVAYITFPDTETKEFVFGIAWIEDVNEENDVQTWFGADPTIMIC